jgi:hypothetical protein
VTKSRQAARTATPRDSLSASAAYLAIPSQGFDLRLAPHKLEEPLRLRKPSTALCFFVSSYSARLATAGKSKAVRLKRTRFVDFRALKVW